LAKKNWIKGAIKHKGALKATAAKSGGIDKATGKIKKSWLNKAANSSNPTTRKRANLAKTLGKMG
jgi:hypothetical protein